MFRKSLFLSEKSSRGGFFSPGIAVMLRKRQFLPENLVVKGLSLREIGLGSCMPLCSAKGSFSPKKSSRGGFFSPVIAVMLREEQFLPENLVVKGLSVGEIGLGSFVAVMLREGQLLSEKCSRRPSAPQ